MQKVVGDSEDTADMEANDVNDEETDAIWHELDRRSDSSKKKRTASISNGERKPKLAKKRPMAAPSRDGNEESESGHREGDGEDEDAEQEQGDEEEEEEDEEEDEDEHEDGDEEAPSQPSLSSLSKSKRTSKPTATAVKRTQQRVAIAAKNRSSGARVSGTKNNKGKIKSL